MTRTETSHLSEVCERQTRGCWADRAFLALVLVLAALSFRTVEMAVHVSAAPAVVAKALP